MKPEWNQTFFELCDVIAKRSDDPHTKLGAVIVDNANRIVSMGYNGFPRGVKCTEERLQRENGVKYKYMVHAEQNAILFADKQRLNGSTLYVQIMPCSRCAQDIIQSGISSVIISAQKQSEYEQRSGSNYKTDFEYVQTMFQEASVVLIYD